MSHRYLYHATPAARVKSILKKGLVPNKRTAGIGGGRVDKGAVWLSSTISDLMEWLLDKYPSRRFAILRVDVGHLLYHNPTHRSKISQLSYKLISTGRYNKSNWYQYKGAISAHYISLYKYTGRRP